MGFELKDLKEEYRKFEKKYGLPEFEKINHDFDIEKIDKESEIFLKHIRKVMMEKVVNVLGFLEMLLNPMNAPRMYMVYVNSVSDEDRKKISEIYNKLSELVLISLESEIEYREKNESEVINKIFSVWNSVRNDLKGILDDMKKPSVNVRKEKNYFG